MVYNLFNTLKTKKMSNINKAPQQNFDFFAAFPQKRKQPPVQDLFAQMFGAKKETQFKQIPKMGFNDWLQTVKQPKAEESMEAVQPIPLQQNVKQLHNTNQNESEQEIDSEEQIIMDDDFQQEYEQIKYWPKIKRARRINYQPGEFRFGSLEG